jgi:copper chaperone CopZ
MKHEYSIKGMTCAGCSAKVKSLLSAVPSVTSVEIDLGNATAVIGMSEHVSITTLKNALRDHPKYEIEERQHVMSPAPVFEEEKKSWFATYKPLILVFFFILVIILSPALVGREISFSSFMHQFMAGFFIAFSFFKFLDLKGFAESYMSYDIIARKWMPWGYIYPFIEFGLGMAYLLHFEIIIAHIVTLVVMSLSIIGVLKSVLNKRKIKCACLGTVFNLPMSTVTIVEDGLMIAMSAIMLIQIL